MFNRNEVLFSSLNWSNNFGELFKVNLIIELPITSEQIKKYNIKTLFKLEKKADTTTKAFIKFLIAFIRFMCKYYYNDILKFTQLLQNTENNENNENNDKICHFDVIMEYFLTYHNIHVCVIVYIFNFLFITIIIIK